MLPTSTRWRSGCARTSRRTTGSARCRSGSTTWGRAGTRKRREPASAWSDDERLVLELTDAMTRDIDVPAEIIDRLKTRFDAQRTVELVATVAAYNMVSRFLVALGVVH